MDAGVVSDTLHPAPDPGLREDDRHVSVRDLQSAGHPRGYGGGGHMRSHRARNAIPHLFQQPLIVSPDPAAPGLDVRALDLRLEAPLPRGPARTGLSPRFRPLRSLLDEGGQALAGRGAVLRLRPVSAAVDQQNAFGCEPGAGHDDQPLPDVPRQRGRIEAKLDCG